MAWPIASTMKENNLYLGASDEKCQRSQDKEKTSFQRWKVKVLPKEEQALIMLPDCFWPHWILQYSEA